MPNDNSTANPSPTVDALRPKCGDRYGAVENLFAAAHDLDLYGGKQLALLVLRHLAESPDLYVGFRRKESNPVARGLVDLLSGLHNLNLRPSYSLLEIEERSDG